MSGKKAGPMTEIALAALDRARAAATAGDWQRAYDLLKGADAATPLTRQDLELLADVAYATGNVDVTIGSWERAHTASVLAGDALGAANAAVRVAMHLLFDTALMAPVRGWLKRAERLLEGEQETSIHAWIAVLRNYERMLSGDFAAAQSWAQRAIELGSQYEPATVALGRVAHARLCILEGNVGEGLELLDEAGVAAVSGELDPLLTGVVYCELVCALQATAQYDRAEEWTKAMERWRQGLPIGSIHGRCRVHRAEILRLRGSCTDAEAEALQACEELRPYLRRELGWPLNELGRIRLRRGDIPGAEDAFVSARDAGWDPEPGLALVRLAQGEVALASEAIREALERPLNVPSKEWPPTTELRRAPLLEAQVEVELCAGNIGSARLAAEELKELAVAFQSSGFAASAGFALGRVHLAEGDSAGAAARLEAAAEAWNEIGAPYEMALARMWLGQALRASGNGSRALVEFRAAQATFARIGASREERTAGAASDLESAEQRPDAALPDEDEQRGEAGTTGVALWREGEYWTVAYAGSTIHMRDLKGLRYLSVLITEPGREFHVLDLIALERDGRTTARGRGVKQGVALRAADEGIPLLDAAAKEAYRRRLIEIDEDIEEAEAMGDIERAARTRLEREFLMRELSRAVGLSGRDRRASSSSERARASVTKAIREAVSRIDARHAALGAHLDRAIRTGAYCAYLTATPAVGVEEEH